MRVKNYATKIERNQNPCQKRKSRQSKAWTQSYVCIHRFMLFDCLHKLWTIWQKLRLLPIEFRSLFWHSHFGYQAWHVCFFTRVVHIQIKVDSKYEQNTRKIRKQKPKLRTASYASAHVKDIHFKNETCQRCKQACYDHVTHSYDHISMRWSPTFQRSCSVQSRTLT